ncbi:hypothetical protein ABPG75_004880 [Micractinium tetrahymenae]
MAELPLFQACLEAYQAASAALPDDAEFPGLDWEGWEGIAVRLGIVGTVDAPVFRTRVAVKTAVAADEANLRGQRVKLAAVEGRLLEVLSGGAPLSQVPDTQAEEAALRPPQRARIVLRDRRRRDRRHNDDWYQVILSSHPGEEGTWVSVPQLRQHFPDSWRQMVEDFNDRLAKGTLLEPSPVDEAEEEEAGGDGAGGAAAAAAAAAQQSQQAQPQQQHRQRWQPAPAPSGASLPSTAAGSMGGHRGGDGAVRLRAPAAALPVGPLNIPLDSQPEPQPLLYDGSKGPAPSLMLAGINLQQAQQQPQQPQVQPGRAAAHPARRSVWGPRAAPQPAAARPAAQAPVHGSGQRAEHLPARPRPQWAPRPRLGMAAPAAAAPAAAAPAAAAPGAAQSSGRSAASGAPAGATAPAAAAEPPRRSMMHMFRKKRPEEIAAAAAQRLGAGAAPTRWPMATPQAAQPQQQQAPLPAAAPAAGAAAELVAPAVGAGVLAAPLPQQSQQCGQAEVKPTAAAEPGGAGSGDAQQPAKRRRRAVAPSAGASVLAAAAAEADAALESAVAGMRRQEAARPRPQARHGLAPPQQQQQQKQKQQQQQQQKQQQQQQQPPELAAAQAADNPSAGAAAVQPPPPAGPQEAGPALPQMPCPAQQRPLPAAGWSASPDDEGDLAFQQGLALMATWENKAPSPSKLNPAGQLLPPGAAVAPAAGVPPAKAGGAQAGAAAAAAAAGEGAEGEEAAMAVNSSPEDEAFHDAREHLESSQHTQQAQQAVAAAAAHAAAAGPADEAGVPPGALHLRTQPDEVQWTNLHDLEPAESLPDTQVINGNGAPVVVPATEDEPAERQLEQTVQQPAEQRHQQAPAAPPAAAERAPAAAAQEAAGGAARQPSPGSPSPSAGAAAAAAVGSQEESGSDSDTEQGVQAVMELAARFRGAIIRGAKATAAGVELYVQWADGTSGRVPTSTLHELAHEDCLGCCVLGKLALFYESKTKSRKRGGSGGSREHGGSGDGGGGE